MNIMNFTKTVMKNLFSKPATNMYPVVPIKYQERSRGHIDIDINSCIYCGLCSRKCPTGAITVDKTNKNWSIERFDCIQCGACTECCPKKCLYMKNEYTTPDVEKSKDVFTGA